MIKERNRRRERTRRIITEVSLRATAIVPVGVLLIAILGIFGPGISASTGDFKPNGSYDGQAGKTGGSFAEVGIAPTDRLGLKDTQDHPFVLIAGGADPSAGAGDSIALSASCSGANEFIQSDLKVYIRDDLSWYGSGIDLSTGLAAVVTCIDVHYVIRPSWVSFVDVALSGDDDNNMYGLEEGRFGADGDIVETRTGITAFNGEPLNQSWTLWAAELFADGTGYIDSWWIKLYYESGPPGYCLASGGEGYEHVSGVVVGDIDNSPTGDDVYADYTDLSTTMEIGHDYAITVSNGMPYDDKDNCGVWVDWNQDMDFDDSGETIALHIGRSKPAGGAATFVGTITPPQTAVPGDTVMRVRMVWNNPANPCGATSYGEVEDYTITVVQGQQTLKVSGYVTLSDDTPLEGVLLEAYTLPGGPSGITDVTDATGYYEIVLPSPWSGAINPSKDNYVFSWGKSFTNVTTDQTQDFSAQYAYSGGFGKSGSPYLIETPEDLNAIGQHPEDWHKYFEVVADIDMSGYAGEQFNIIGNGPQMFSGSFDGNGHQISKFTYHSTETSNIGIFGNVGGVNAVLKNVELTNPDVDGQTGDAFGSLVGQLKEGTVSNCHVKGGNVQGDKKVGGLVGLNLGVIVQCSSSTSVSGEHSVGGLVGFNYVSDNTHAGVIYRSTSSSSVAGTWDAGGLVGNNWGYMYDCYAAGDVTGGGSIGGLAGSNVYIDDAPAAVTGTISRCYSTGRVSGQGPVGGLVGSNLQSGSEISDSFWDSQSSGQSNMCGENEGNGCANINGRTTEEMKMVQLFIEAGWDFAGETRNGTDDIWDICDGMNYPKLAWQEPPTGDFACPDGVDFVDYALLSNYWGQANCGRCGELDLTGDGDVAFDDLARFVGNWLAGI